MNIDKRFLDPLWRLENLYYIVDKNGNKVKLKQNKVQKILNEPVKRKRILKARQMGISTNELIKQLDFVLFNKNKTAVILAHERDTIEKLFTIVRRAYDSMHPEIRPELDKGGGSRYAMQFPKMGSRIYCDLESVGSTCHWLHVSEVALNKEPTRIKYTEQSVPYNGIITHETTARGMNHFYDDYMNPGDFKNYFFPWFLHEEYKITNHELKTKDLNEDEINLINVAKDKYNIGITLDQIEFRRFKQRELKGLFKQEYAETDSSCFLTSGENPFDLTIIKGLYDNAPKPVEIINGIRIYEKPEQKELYVIGADTAEGVGGDNSAAHVFKVSNRQQVASFHGQSKPSEFADKLIEMSELYSMREPILIGVERNNHGHAVLLKLDEVLNYPHLYKYAEDKLGWQTDKITRPLMIDLFIEGVENSTVKLVCKDTLDECLTLTANSSGKIEASDNKHDDLFISACISVQMCIEESHLDIYSNIANRIKT